MTRKRFGYGLLSIAMAIFLIVSGIMTLQLKSGVAGFFQAELSGNEIYSAVHYFLKGDAANAVVIALGICEIVAGVFLVLRLFGVFAGKIANLFSVIVIILWAVILILIDVIGKNGIFGGNVFTSMSNCLSWLKSIATHMTILGALMTVHAE